MLKTDAGRLPGPMSRAYCCVENRCRETYWADVESTLLCLKPMQGAFLGRCQEHMHCCVLKTDAGSLGEPVLRASILFCVENRYREHSFSRLPAIDAGSVKLDMTSFMSLIVLSIYSD